MDIGHEPVEVAVVVGVAGRGPHTVLVFGDPGRRGLVAEAREAVRARALVDQQAAGAEVRGEQQVGQAVAREVDHPRGVAPRAGEVDAHRVGRVDELWHAVGIVAGVDEQAVAGGVNEPGAGHEVEVAVVVDVAEGGAHAVGAGRECAHARGEGGVLEERAVRAEPVEQQPVAGVGRRGVDRAERDDVEVGAPVSVHVASGDRAAAVEVGDAPIGRAISERAVPVVDEEPVGLVAPAERKDVWPAVGVEITDAEAPGHLVVRAGVAGGGGEGVGAADVGGAFSELGLLGGGKR